MSGTLAQNIWTTTRVLGRGLTSGLPLAGTEPTVGIGARAVITSADHSTNEFTYGAAGTFTITTTGFPTPSLSESGALPGGVTFTDKGDGTATLTGTPTAAGNFILTITAHNGYGSDATQTFTLTVNKATATPSITADDKYYDGTTAATIHCTLSGVLAADTANVTCSGTGSFADANAGPGKTVTSNNIVLGGSASGNYMLSTTTATTSAKINAKPVTATITASNKNYDGNNTATITSCTIPGKVGSDDVACSVPAGNATFASANASPTAQTVTATGITLSGNTSSNYTLSTNTSATTTATINTAPLTITANDKSKTYGGTDPIFDVSYSGFVNSESASVLAGTAVFNFAGKPPTSYGPSTTVPTNAGIYAVRPSGLTSSNYAITFKGGTYTINQATPTVTVTDPMPTYDGNPHAGYDRGGRRRWPHGGKRQLQPHLRRQRRGPDQCQDLLRGRGELHQQRPELQRRHRQRHADDQASRIVYDGDIRVWSIHLSRDGFHGHGRSDRRGWTERASGPGAVRGRLRKCHDSEWLHGHSNVCR